MSFSGRPISPKLSFIALVMLMTISWANAVVHPSYPYCTNHLGEFIHFHMLPSKHDCHLLISGRWVCNVSLTDQTRLPEGTDDTMCAFPRMGRTPGFVLEYSSSSSSMLSVWDFGQSDTCIHDNEEVVQFRPFTGLVLLHQHRRGAVNRSVDSINFATAEEATRCGQEAINWCEYLGGEVKVALLRNDTKAPWVSVEEPLIICRLPPPDVMDIEVLTLYFGIDHWTNEDLRRALHMDEAWWTAAATKEVFRAAVMEETG